MICPSCGKHAHGSQFCTQCGAALPPSAPAGDGAAGRPAEPQYAERATAAGSTASTRGPAAPNGRRTPAWVWICTAAAVAAVVIAAVVIVVVHSRGSGYGAIAGAGAVISSQTTATGTAGPTTSADSGTTADDTPATTATPDSPGGTSDDASPATTGAASTTAPQIPAWCDPTSTGGSAVTEFPGVLQPGQPVKGLNDALAELAQIPGVSPDSGMLQAAIAAEKPAPSYADEAFGRALAQLGSDPSDFISTLNDDAQTSCGIAAFDPDSARAAAAGPSIQGGMVSDAQNTYGECDNADGSKFAGVISGARTATLCSGHLVLVGMLDGAMQLVPATTDNLASAASGQTTVAWLTSVVTPAAGLSPPVWTVKAYVYDTRSNKVTEIGLPIPKVNAVAAQGGDVDIESDGSDIYIATVSGSGGGVAGVVIGPSGKVLTMFTPDDGNPLDSFHTVVGPLAQASPPSGNSAAGFFNGLTGQWIAIPGVATGDSSIATDGGCGGLGLVLTSQSGDTTRYGPNSLVGVGSKGVTVTAFPDFDWVDTQSVVGVTPHGVVVTVQDSDDRTFLELLASKDAHVVWRIGDDRIQPGSARLILGVIRAQNNSDQTLLIDPTNGREMTGLSRAAAQLTNFDGDGSSWVMLTDGKSKVYVASNGDTANVLTPSDGVCR